MTALTSNNIGLDQEQSLQTAEKLNKLLATYQVFYMNVRGLHWNIRGMEFFVLHEKFEELYRNSSDKIDAIAERILALGAIPMHSNSDYLGITVLDEKTNINNGQKAIQTVLAGLKALLVIEREILDFAGEAGDEGTNALMSDLIGEQEELVWMYSAVLG